ncbi:MAG: hypothetical protein EOL97_14510 [Spirochaetia bacterium]|nr:hypothetical protein [Spirochaetia bacterium]
MKIEEELNNLYNDIQKFKGLKELFEIEESLNPLYEQIEQVQEMKCTIEKEIIKREELLKEIKKNGL